ncbi:hypothetical protein BKM31_45925 [[Actinomadura] parvosata subsp. kistnae]|uniref:histidine kinase n=1 Tax=[Actinomadura] parvosata subsp. kistnae TaxID=1909395 RepID=A0A1V0ACB7_9ACTN|nr:hypothetical protein BKM31_45925 [Nonomuraea sp. ATCC 55076]
MPLMGRDALLACAVAIIALTVSALNDRWHGQPVELTPAWAAPILAACAPLVLRRRLPLTAVVASALVMLALGLALERDAGIWVLGLIVASAAYHRHRLRSLLLAGSVGWAVAAGLGGRPVVDLATVSVYAAAGAAPVTIGYALRLRADRAVQAARLRRAREEQARSQEAARIAREVHDVVGHHLSAIRLQAVGARRTLTGHGCAAGRTPAAHDGETDREADRTPAGHGCEADRALAGIAELSAEALAEIRALLATLVRSDGAPGEGFADLPALVERSGGPALAVTLEADPDLDSTVHPETAACAYRIVQEALTNVARHSTATTASVAVRRRSGRVVVTVDDPGPSRPADDNVPGGGHGLTGMRDRAAALGGDCHAGPHGRNGWRVRATLPVLPPQAPARAAVRQVTP